MSWKISGLVWELDLTHSQQSVLLAMADHAEHDGSKVFPSVARIAWKTNYSERQVRRVMSELREMKILVIEKESNRYRPREYRIDISAGKKKKPFRGDTMSSLAVEDEDTAISRDDTGDTPEASDLTLASTRDDIATSIRGDIAVSPDSSLTIIKPSEEKDSKSQDLWLQALAKISLKIPRHEFETWWRDTWVVGIKDGKIKIGVCNQFTADYLADHADGVQEIVSEIAGKQVEVEFICG